MQLLDVNLIRILTYNIMADENKILTGGELLAMYQECLPDETITWDNFNNTIFQGELVNSEQCIFNNKTSLSTPTEFWASLRGLPSQATQYAYVGPPHSMTSLLPFTSIEKNKLIAKGDIKDPTQYFLQVPNKNANNFIFSFVSATIQNSFKIEVKLNEVSDTSHTIYTTGGPISVNSNTSYNKEFNSYGRVLGQGGQLILIINTTGITSMTDIKATLHSEPGGKFAEVTLGSTTGNTLSQRVDALTAKYLPLIRNIRAIEFSGTFVGTSSTPTMPSTFTLEISSTAHIALNPVNSNYTSTLYLKDGYIQEKSGQTIYILDNYLEDNLYTLTDCTISSTKIVFKTEEWKNIGSGTYTIKVPFYLSGAWVYFLIEVDWNGDVYQPYLTLADHVLKLLLIHTPTQGKIYMRNESEKGVWIVKDRQYTGQNSYFHLISNNSGYLSNYMLNNIPHVLEMQSDGYGSKCSIMDTQGLYILGSIPEAGAQINLLNNAVINTWQHIVNALSQMIFSYKFVKE